MRRFSNRKRQEASIPLSTPFHRRKRSDQSVENPAKALSRCALSKKGMAIPVTFLILFVSLSFVISLTYYFAVNKINDRSQLLRTSAAKQNMLYFEDSVASVAWSPGSSHVYSFDDCGGIFRVNPDEKNLLINVTDNSFYDVVFNGSVGKALYELPPAELWADYSFLKGDKRVVVNQSMFTMTQLYISQGTRSPEITLCYRPLASSTEIGPSNGKPVNSARIYVVSLDSSQNLTFQGNFLVKVTCLNVTSSLQTYNFSYAITSLLVKVEFDGSSGEVSVPVSSNEAGALVNLEIIRCDIQLGRVGG